MAAEASLCARRVGLVFTTTGPGFTNALTGLAAAAWDGARVLCVVGGTKAASAGRHAFQETGADLLKAADHLAPNITSVFAHNPEQVRDALEHAAAWQGPEGGVLVLGLPDDLARTAWTGSTPTMDLPATPPPQQADLDAAAAKLAGTDFVIWAGFGARHASAEIQTLAERTGCRVMLSPRAKGVFDERHPQCLGTTGLGGLPRVLAALAERPPEHLLVLGSRLSEFTSNLDPAYLPPAGTIVHVDCNRAAFGKAYPEAKTLPVLGDVRQAATALCTMLPARPAPAPLDAAVHSPPTGSRGMHPAHVMDCVQRNVVERSDAVILSEAGNAFAWASRELRLPAPGRYRTSTRFAAMGHASAGVIGVALARPGGALAVLGDGAMLMTNEVNTAVALRARAIWLVLNDGQYGMVHHGMQALGLEPCGIQIPRVDFVKWAEAQGALGLSAQDISTLDAALREALATPGPVVIDVRVDPQIPPPFGNRNDRLQQS